MINFSKHWDTGGLFLTSKGAKSGLTADGVNMAWRHQADASSKHSLYAELVTVWERWLISFAMLLEWFNILRASDI